MTSHAAVVARGMGLPAVTGCSAIEVDLEENLFRIGDLVVHAGDELTLDGSTGRVILGKAPTIQPKLDGEIQTLLTWADEFRDLAFAPTPTRRPMSPARGSSARKASGCAARSICSLDPNGSRRCAR